MKNSGVKKYLCPGEAEIIGFFACFVSRARVNLCLHWVERVFTGAVGLMQLEQEGLKPF